MSRRVFSQVAHGSDAYKATITLRNTVLREPLGLILTKEELDREHADFHLACHEESKLVGCLVLSPLTGGDIRMRQFG